MLAEDNEEQQNIQARIERRYKGNSTINLTQLINGAAMSEG